MILSTESTGSILRFLTYSVDELVNDASAITPEDFEINPRHLPDSRWDTLLRALYGKAFIGVRTMSWTHVTPLDERWDVHDNPMLRERAKTSTPSHLKLLNIYIDAASLKRA
jgi:hypothetical protein